MKKLLLMVTAVATLFTACNKEADHNNVKHDHSADIVGTWTCLTADYAEALIINADGSAVSYGVENGEYWENVKGSVIVDGDNITMNFEDNDNLTGHFDIIPGQSFSLFEDSGERYIYQYCANDLSEEIIGMWVSTDNSSDEDNNVLIQIFYENGKSTYTGFAPLDGEIILNKESNYNVIGDVNFQEINGKYTAWKLSYFKNGTSSGDIMTNTNGDFTESWLRVKQHLNLTGLEYAYSTAYITNAKGKDEDFSILGSTFNIANIEGGNFDVIFGSDLFCVELNANSIKHMFRIDGQHAEFNAPITVDGNKVTLEMSEVNPAFRTVTMYMFQDANDSQLHMYMPTKSFINYIANLGIRTLLLEGKIDITDTAAVDKVFADMEARIESINVSFVFKARK
jgi:hypothetical protein